MMKSSRSRPSAKSADKLAFCASLVSLFFLSDAVASAAPGQPAAAGQGHALEEIVVTAQRRSERIQDVPIAVTALSGADLEDLGIENGSNIAQQVPNMSFQPGAFAKPNFVIRGIGYQLVTSTGEAGVAIHENDAPLTISRIAQEDFFDIDRIEVLRGPQGTLYGRNATGGVVNVITNTPTNSFEASITGDVGDYDTYKTTGFVNVPLGDMFALRLAGDYHRRGGYQDNAFNGHDIHDVDTLGTRATLAFNPTDSFQAQLMWEHFREDDGGSSNGGNTRAFCLRDPGPAAIGTTSLTDGNPFNGTIRAFESLGCAPTPIDNNQALTGVVNGVGDFGNRLGLAVGLASTDIYANNTNPGNRYDISVDQDPFNKSTNDLGQLKLEWDLSNQYTLTSLSTYSLDHVRAGIGGVRAQIPFNFGITVDTPQIPGGPLPFWTQYNFNDLKTREYSQELRLQSSFGGPIDFSVGAIYVHLERRDNVFIFDNINKYFGTTFLGTPVDPKPATSASGGHYYFQSLNPYKLTSYAAFGELYWTLSDSVKVTAGLRYTNDKKTFFANDSASNLLTPGFGINYDTAQRVQFKKPTGRLNIDWRPSLPFTDESLLYATYSRGYKGGGFNPPNLVPQGSYKPEYVNDYEVGMKNELLDRSLQVNLSAFFYDYKGYQFTQAAVFGTLTSNVDAHIKGAEIETAWQPNESLRLNAQGGYLKTEIQSGSTSNSIDQYNPTGGDPNLSFMKTLLGGCVVNTANFAHLLDDIKNGVNTAGGATPPSVVELANTFFAPNLCQGTRPEYNLGAGVPGGLGVSGVPVSIAGNRLPNVPEWTFTLGADYTYNVNARWTLTPRVDYHYQGDIYTDLFNNKDNRVSGYGTVNAALTLADPDDNLVVRAYVKNLTDSDAITGAAVGGGAILGNPRSITVLDPRTYGISVTKGF